MAAYGAGALQLSVGTGQLQATEGDNKKNLPVLSLDVYEPYSLPSTVSPL